MMRSWMRCAALALVGLGVGCDSEEVVTTPPAVTDASITCVERDGLEYPVVQTVSMRVTDAERDLLDTEIEGYVNGLRMEGIADPDADEVFTWSPPSAWDPPMVCRGEFTLLIRARDASGLSTEETLAVQK